MSEVPQPEPSLTAEETVLIASLSAAEVDAIDHALLSNTHDRWRKVAMVVGKTMGELANRRHGIPDTYYAQRVRKLVEDGALESQGNLAYMRFSEVRRPQPDTESPPIGARMDDPYFKLKPREPTPVDECCQCEQLSAVYLAHKLADNPIYCQTCRGEVAPERIGFDDPTTETLVRWHDVYAAIYCLWLDSGAYEKWAEAELLNKESEVNRLGMRAREALAGYLPTSYLWFWQEDRPTTCPLCGSNELATRGKMFLCEKCHVAL